MTAFRYMGTKRHLSSQVRQSVVKSSANGHVADLFSGMGAVAREFASDRPVLLNDVMKYSTTCSSAHFKESSGKPLNLAVHDIYPLFRDHREFLRKKYRQRINRERFAIDSGQEQLAKWMSDAPHVGNSLYYQRKKKKLRSKADSERYQLTTMYFSASYFGTEQAIDIDALRYAIDTLYPAENNEPLLAMWLTTASVLVNSPGHSAQFLKPNSDISYKRICRHLNRDVWSTFVAKVDEFSPCGSKHWRKQNLVTQSDTLALIGSGLPDTVSTVYADPPYSGDQYSRFYHVFETLIKYDFPESTGCGRYSDRRFSSDFCLKTKVEKAFTSLFEGVAMHSVPLVLSYPSNGLLQRVGIDVVGFTKDHFHRVRVEQSEMTHSTMGASKGESKKSVIEYILTCYST